MAEKKVAKQKQAAPRKRKPATQIIDVATAIEEFSAGRPLIIVDDEDRENEGDVCLPAQFVTPEFVNFLARQACGLICVPMSGERADQLELPPMTHNNTAPLETAFTLSVEAREGVTTGISAADRARTIAVLADPQATAADLTRPGHIFPLRARDGGTLVRNGQTEASVDLCVLAGLEPVSIVCEILNPDGTMARLPDLKKFARKYGMKIVTVADITAYRLRTERLIERVGEASLPTVHGDFRAIGYRTLIDTKEHMALVMGEIDDGEPILVRVHDQCVTGDVFGSLRCDCGEQLEAAMKIVAAEGRGVILYMDQEGRGIGLHNKLLAYELQEQGLDTVEANEALGLPAENREYGIGSQILLDLGVRKMRLMTNNPTKVAELQSRGQLRAAGLGAFGLEVVERIPIEIQANPHNIHYLQTKRDKMGHYLEQPMPGLG